MVLNRGERWPVTSLGHQGANNFLRGVLTF